MLCTLAMPLRTSGTILFMPAITITCCGPWQRQATRLPTPSILTSSPSNVMALELIKQTSEVTILPYISLFSSGVTALARSYRVQSDSIRSSIRPISSSVSEPPQEMVQPGVRKRFALALASSRSVQQYPSIPLVLNLPMIFSAIFSQYSCLLLYLLLQIIQGRLVNSKTVEVVLFPCCPESLYPIPNNSLEVVKYHVTPIETSLYVS